MPLRKNTLGHLVMCSLGISRTMTHLVGEYVTHLPLNDSRYISMSSTDGLP
jgi:hypothetical protein